MHPGFSYVGLLYLVMLIIPNVVWTKKKPRDEAELGPENRVLTALEGIGRVLMTGASLAFSDLNGRRLTLWSLWLFVSFLCMALYEVFWIRYFRRRTWREFYRSLLFVPVPGAFLPAAAFFFLGIYGSCGLLILGAVLFGIGHVGIHLAHRREVLGEEGKRRSRAGRIGRGVLLLLAVLGLALISLVIGVRNVRFLRHLPNLASGVEEGLYLPLGDQLQYVLLTGRDETNPVIVYLHGGPSSPDSYAAYAFADHLTEDFTFVCWDQRGCGRTYFRNRREDPENDSATFARALEDLDDLVDYVRERFGKEQVILMGHSYGTILGSQYALAHPEKISAYLGIAQVTSLAKTDLYSYEDALARAGEAGDDLTALKEAYEAYEKEGSLSNLMAMRRLTAPYHPVPMEGNETWDSVFSPYFGMDDFRWFLKQLGPMEDYYALNRQLFDFTFGFDGYDGSLTYAVPVYLISGSEDWICPVDSVREYFSAVTAPEKELFLLEGCGHNAQYGDPVSFARIVREVLGEKE